MKKIFSNTFWKSVLKPWRLIPQNKMAFFLWFAFTIFAGQIGVLVNVILRVINGDFTLEQSIYLDSSSGSFYTYSIALIASLLGPLFVNFIENSPNHFRSIKIGVVTIGIFALFFCGVFYATSIKDTFDAKYLSTKTFAPDYWQLSFLIIAVILSIYCFSVFKLDFNSKEFEDINDFYSKHEDKKTEGLTEKSKGLTTDENGNRV